MRNIYILLIVVLIFSCEEKTDNQILPNNENILVVEALITNEYINQEVKLSETVSELNGVPRKVSGAVVTITDGDTTFSFFEDPLELGIYKSVAFSAVSDKYYFLSIKYNGVEYGAEAYMIPVTPFEPISFSQNDEELYNIDKSFNSSEDAMWEFYIDWSMVDSSATNKALLYYYTLHSVDVAQLFAPKTETVYFPSGTHIIQRKYSLTPEYAKFIRTLLSETEWTGGYFDVTPANLSTNLSHGAIGFFAACTVFQRDIVVK